MQTVIFAVNSFWLVVLAFLASSILVTASGFCNVKASAPEIAPLPDYASSPAPKTAHAYAPMQRAAQSPEMPVLDWLNAPAPGISASEALAPSFFIYGDSTVDSGNNNYLRTLARANIPPYGRDFDTHRPTGRFSNGRLSIDYLASFMGLPFAPPYLSEPNFTMKLYGVNFASAGAGVFTASGNDLGQHIPLADQVREAFEFKKELSLTYGGQTASSFMANSIHYISVGSNDFIHYYLRNVSGIEVEERPIQFNERLIAELASQIEVLYDVGIRKVVTVGIGPLGCAPYFLYQYNSSDGACISDINYLIEEYNALLGLKVEELSLKYHDLNIIFCNIYDSLKQIVQDPLAYGKKDLILSHFIYLRDAQIWLQITLASNTGVPSPLLCLGIDELEGWTTQFGGDSAALARYVILLLLYADNIVLLSRSVQGMQKHLDALASFYDNKGMRVNMVKTKVCSAVVLMLLMEHGSNK